MRADAVVNDVLDDRLQTANEHKTLPLELSIHRTSDASADYISFSMTAITR